MVQRQHMVTINYNAKSEGYAETCDAYGQSYGEDNKCKITAIYNRYTHTHTHIYIYIYIYIYIL